MRVAVVGIGHVGAVLCGCLADMGHDVVAVDVDGSKIDAIVAGRLPVREPGLDRLIAASVAAGRLRATDDVRAAIAASALSFVCVGTPGGADGRLSLAQVEQSIGEIGRALRATGQPHSVVLRSTVPPGTAEDLCIPLLERCSGRRNGSGLHVLSNPEFLREGSAVRDFRNPPGILVGVSEPGDALPLREVYRCIDAPFRISGHRTVESVKLLSNIYHALKVGFANEGGAVLAACGVDVNEAFALFCADDVLNVSPAYLRPGFAFGGSCLTKDLRSFLALAQTHAVSTPLLKQLEPSNVAVIDRLVERILASGWRSVALLGLVFKAGTADLRESPYVALARRLMDAGVRLRLFDAAFAPGQAEDDRRLPAERVPPDLAGLLAASPDEAIADSDVTIVAHRGAVAPHILPSLLSGRTVIDLEGIDELRLHPGIVYQSAY